MTMMAKNRVFLVNLAWNDMFYQLAILFIFRIDEQFVWTQVNVLLATGDVMLAALKFQSLKMFWFCDECEWRQPFRECQLNSSWYCCVKYSIEQRKGSAVEIGENWDNEVKYDSNSLGKSPKHALVQFKDWHLLERYFHIRWLRKYTNKNNIRSFQTFYLDFVLLQT